MAPDKSRLRVLLVQLPIPQLNYGKRTGNIPLGAACLKQAASDLPHARIELVPESVASYAGDAALVSLIRSRQPDVVGFSVFCWNIDRSLSLAAELKSAHGPKIVFGGPEITPDNPRLPSPAVDFLVFGEGEALFRRLLSDPEAWRRPNGSETLPELFSSAPSPYLSGGLEPDVEDMVLLETQRGCPYRCAYCYYNKSRGGLCSVDPERVVQCVRWTVERRIGELFFLDPSLNTRTGLKDLLRDIARTNPDRKLRLLSEIRAEAIDDEIAALFAAAGFSWFEIGLQSTNPAALRAMKRPTDLKAFCRGVNLLKAQGIACGIDLIVGLPGDDLSGFRASVDFVADHGFGDDIQVFPLSVLPGTEFRTRSTPLGLAYEPDPPYSVIRSPGFSSEDILHAMDYAESRFDVALYPMPRLDVAFRKEKSAPGDVAVRVGTDTLVSKIFLQNRRPASEMEALAGRLTHPYQILVGKGVRDPDYLCGILGLLTRRNPFTPLEVVFLDPDEMPDTDRLLSSLRLFRPHFLDLDQRYLFARPGNRAALFTLVSANPPPGFAGEMQRRIFWWRSPALPTMDDLRALLPADGVVIDSPVEEASFRKWQDRHRKDADDLLLVGFFDIHLQHRWMRLTASEEYWFGAFQSA